MSPAPMVPLEHLMAARQGSVDPAKFADHTFELYSIPAFDSRKPEVLAGREIGSTKQVVRPRDVLLSKIVPHIRRAWIVGAAGEYTQIGSGEWIVFRSEKVVPEYLRHALLCDDFHTQFMQTVSGVGGSLLRARPAQVAKIEIRLPSIAEQRRIAAILDKADALRTKRREALTQLDCLARAIFVEMFGDPGANPKNWQLRTLGSIANKFSDGPFGSNLKSEHYKESGVRVVRLQNIGVGVFVDNDRAFISREHFEKIKKHECIPGDVLVGTLGDPNVRACIQPEFVPLAINKADCVQIRVNESLAHPEYVCALLNHPSTEVLARALMRGQTRVRVSMGSLRGLEVPIPPVSLQQRFADRIEALRMLRKRQLNAAEACSKLFQSLQHRAFQGEL